MVDDIQKYLILYARLFGLETPESFLTGSNEEAQSVYRGKTTDGRARVGYIPLENIVLLKKKSKEETGYKFLIRFENEILDYEEFLLNLKNIKKIRKNIRILPIEDQQKELSKYVKLLNIARPEDKKDMNYFRITFKWDDIDEARKILEDTINLSIKNLEKSIYKELEQIVELKLKKKQNEDKKKLDYLIEQSYLAKEVNIRNSATDTALNQRRVVVDINTSNDVDDDDAYFLRGYKVIDKEIELIKNRDYRNIKFINQEINSFKKETVNWVDHDIYLIEVESLQNTKLILIISILVGLVVGVFYAIISNELKSQNSIKKNN